VEGCDKKFTTQGHLKDHIRRHNNERSFVCALCGASFLRASTLKIHNRRHTGERPYKCMYPDCGKSFSESGNLKTHMKTHESTRECRRLSRRNRIVTKDENANAKEGVFQVPEEPLKKIVTPNEKFVEDDNMPGNLVQGIRTKPAINSINLDDLPICEPDYNNSSPNSFYAAQLLSPPCFNSKINYEITNPQVFIKSYGSSVPLYSQGFPKLPSPGPKDFLGGYADFTSFVQDVGGANGLLLDPGNASSYLVEGMYPARKEESEENKF